VEVRTLSLQGQVVIVTGSARGIGRFVAGTFAREGARLALVDVDQARLEQTVAELRATGADVLTVNADVGNEDAVQRMMDQVAAHYGQIDVLVNNAGIATHFAWAPLWSPIRNMERSFWDRIIQTNLGGTFLCTKHALRHMRPRQAGHIINLHGGGSPQNSGSCVYVVSKDAIRTFTRYVAEEERDANICIVVVSPGGAIATEDASEAAKQSLPGPDAVGDAFVLAAQAGMEQSGRLFRAWNGGLQAVEP